MATGMSSCRTPTGKVIPCLSQKERRQTLLVASRSTRSVSSRVMCVPVFAVRKILRCIGDWRVPSSLRRWTLPLEKSEPLRRRLSRW
jgi:hypothetical protein